MGEGVISQKNIFLFKKKISDAHSVSIRLSTVYDCLGQCITHQFVGSKGAQWLSGRVLNSRPRGSGSSLTGFTVLCP